MGKKAVFLDRDGVINRSLFRNGRPHAPETLEELEILEGVPEALHQLKKNGLFLFIFTNQPDVGKGIVQKSVIEKMHEYLQSRLPIDDIAICTHTDVDQCACRKPRPGMILDLQKKWPQVDLTQSFVVGDRWRDIEAGVASGCQTFLVGDGYGERDIFPDFKVNNLKEASEKILDLIKRK